MLKEIHSIKKLIKVEATTWNTLKELKKGDETFDDVVKGLLSQRTKMSGNDNIQLLQYTRKTAFFMSDDVSYEIEYNDVKSNKLDFELDLKIRKVFSRRRSYNPSEFFENKREAYLKVYFEAVAIALKKEFGVSIGDCSPNIMIWQSIYKNYDLSRESFINDIEDKIGDFPYNESK